MNLISSRALLGVLFMTLYFMSIGQNIIVKPYLQNASPLSMTIMWEADNNGTGSIIWGDTPFTLDSTTSSTSQVGSGNTRIHTAILSLLSPNSKYYYKVEMQNGMLSSLYHFVTSGTRSKIQLVAISDMQRDGSQPGKFAEIINQGIIPTVISELGPDLSELEAVLIPGDLVATGGNYNQWKDHFFNPSEGLFSFIPLYPVLGNHEYGNGGFSNFIKYFSLPENGPAGLLEECWHKDINNLRVIGLNSNSDAPDKATQLVWLENTLDNTCDNPDIDFVFAELHHPHKSELWTPGESTFTGDVIHLLEAFTDSCGKASIHFFGHTHAYSRGQSKNYEHLWINVATAGGAIDNWGEFPNADYPEFVKSQDEYGFVMVEVVSGLEPQFTIRRYTRGDQDTIIDNVLRDELTLKKQEFPPYQPQNMYPDNDTVQATCLTLKGTEFYGIDDTHQGSQWQVSLGGDFVDSLVVDDWFQSENFYFEVNLQANDDLTDAVIDQPLTVNKKYYWRVRYRDQYLKWSQWSDTTSFYLEPGGNDITGNLIKNPGAEAGTTGWSGDIESLLNGQCASVPPYAGSHNFGVGGICQNEMTIGIASQMMDFSSYAADIDNGLLSVNFGAFMRDFSGADLPEIYLEFYDINNTLLETTASISNQTDTWTQVTSLLPIPLGTRTCTAILKGTRNGGTDNDSYFDDIFVVIKESITCPICFGESNIDVDGDGYCDDLDCNDNDATIHPGALETCDGIDNNCDNKFDSSDTISWTGNGASLIWNEPSNWSQNIVPLPCQHVIIATQDTVTIDGNYACASLEIAVNNGLVILENSLLNIDGDNTTIPATNVLGSIEVLGKCKISSADVMAFSVEGTLENHGIIFVNSDIEDCILIKNGGVVNNQGKFECK